MKTAIVSFLFASLLPATTAFSAEATTLTPRAIARDVPAAFANTAEQQAILKLLQDFETAFSEVSENSTFSDLRKAVKNLRNIPVADCPAGVQTAFKKFIEDIDKVLASYERIFGDLKISDETSLAEAEEKCSDPKIAEELKENARALQTSAMAFAQALIPYLMPR